MISLAKQFAYSNYEKIHFAVYLLAISKAKVGRDT